jgi:hypothetical protein
MEITECWESPGRTVTVVVWDDGMVQVVADQEPAPGDWLAACGELERLGTPALGLPRPEGEHDIWQTRLAATAAA